MQLKKEKKESNVNAEKPTETEDRNDRSCPGNSSLLSSLLQTLGVPPPSPLHGPAVGSTFASEVAPCTPGLNWSV